MFTEKEVVKQPRVYSVPQHFDYTIKRQRRKTMALHVLADASVEVRVPKWVPGSAVIHFVESRIDWVVQQRTERLLKKQFQPVYSNGHQHYFLGQQYLLRVSKATRSRTVFIDGLFLVDVRDPQNSGQVQKSLEHWYRTQAQGYYEERLFACFESFPNWFQDKFVMPEITIRKMRRRWGSCSSTGQITLNLSLIRMPQDCIDYVVVHELCHLHAFHHGKAFYQLLGQVMPAWKEREALIEHIG